MIERYTLPEMAAVWSTESKLALWRQVEIAAAVARRAPQTVLDALGATPPPSPHAVAAEEVHTRHDVVAFLNVWRQPMEPEVAKWVHLGMTSSDLVDTANALRLREIERLIAHEFQELTAEAARHALAHWDTLRVGRTHGQNAEPTSWGYRVAEFALALERSGQVLRHGSFNVQTAKLSGPVGNYRHTTFEEEARFARALNLNAAFCATQVVSRDRLADFMYALARIASVIESFALEVRLGAQSQTAELAEGFAPGQQGSSAMPHKQNPISAEQLCGLAKLVRAQLDPVMQGISLWNERDISHSSVERLAVQTATTLTHYMVVTATRLLRDLVVRPEVMLANLDSAGDATLSAHIKDHLISKGMHPTEAWDVVRVAAARSPEPLEKAVRAVLALRYPPELVAVYDGLRELPVPDTGHVRQRLAAMVREYEGRSITLYLMPDGLDGRRVDLTDSFVPGTLAFDEPDPIDNGSPDYHG